MYLCVHTSPCLPLTAPASFSSICCSHCTLSRTETWQSQGTHHYYRASSTKPLLCNKGRLSSVHERRRSVTEAKSMGVDHLWLRQMYTDRPGHLSQVHRLHGLLQVRLDVPPQLVSVTLFHWGQRKWRVEFKHWSSEREARERMTWKEPIIKLKYRERD